MSRQKKTVDLLDVFFDIPNVIQAFAWLDKFVFLNPDESQRILEDF